MFINDKFNLSDKLTLTSAGLLVFKDVRIANSGNIQAYPPWELLGLPEHLQDKEEILIYRPPKEVKKGIQSFSNLTVTQEHPDEEVTVENFIDYSVGLSSDVSFKKGHLVASSIVITDSDMIEELQSSKGVQLSCGYTAKVVYKAGKTKSSEPYDAYMKNFEGNHIAIVKRGKCGSSCKLQ
jgi:hypothetical protein